ncbi:four-carbon acid sugar kinase family protein [Amnibacterium endophyticum]|uniref:Four-carbon acid sugar kinase family protein n=1 Tax=Amnibacterium endophyticum TaxID=2109337 RepID=A0ABW4LB01_9MICO
MTDPDAAPRRELADLLDALPPEHRVPDARARIRAANVAAGRRFAVLDDDPTGSQSVHDVALVTVLERPEYAAALAEPGAVAFLLTNSRGLLEPDAAALNEAVAGDLFALEAESGGEMALVSRSDSTLRGHVTAEVAALDGARRAAHGRGYDGVLLVPAFFEAGRLTVDDVHWVMGADGAVPAGESEFARDATFGYTARTLPGFLAERSGGAIDPADVATIPLAALREGGPDRVADILHGVSGGRFVVVNAASYADLEVVVLGLQQAESAGKRFLHRCGPSFVRALAGIEPALPLTPDRIPLSGGGGAHGLVVVGSHTAVTTRQLDAALARGGLVHVEVDASALAAEATADAVVDDAARRVREALATSDVVVSTSRALVREADAAGSLGVAQRISQGLVRLTEQVRETRPAWVIAKGGITSHDVMARGRGIRRGRVLGQVLPGAISVLLPDDAPAEVEGTPVVIFPGNVGGDTALADAIDLLRAAAARRDEATGG